MFLIRSYEIFAIVELLKLKGQNIIQKLHNHYLTQQIYKDRQKKIYHKTGMNN